MAIVVTNTTSGQNASGVNTITVTSTTGNLLVLSVSPNSGTATVTNVSDNVNSNYAQVGTAQTVSTTTAQMFYFPAAAAGATTLTLTFSANKEFAWQWFELTGANSSSPLETSLGLSNQTATNNPVGPQVVTTGAADIVISLCVTTATCTAVAAPFTGSFPDAANTGTGFAYDNTTSAGTYSPSWTTSGSNPWGGITAAFSAPSGTIFMLGHL